MAFEGIQDLWYTLRGELDKESKNLIKEATGHKVDNLIELSEIGMSIYAGKVASKKIVGKLGEESEKLSGLLKKTRKPVSVVTRTKRLVKKFMPKKRYRKFKVVDVEELAKKQCLKPNIQLFADDRNSWKQISEKLVKEKTNVGSWNKGSFDSVQDSLARHFEKHGVEVGASNVEQYLRKAEHFKINLKGASKRRVSGLVDNVVRYSKNGRYIDLAPDGTIISFGTIN